MGFPITHKDVPGSLGEALDDQQFAQIWEPRGWERAPVPEEFTEPVAAHEVIAEDDAPEAVAEEPVVQSRRNKNAPEPTVESIEGV